jgi:hypothetical protein
MENSHTFDNLLTGNAVRMTSLYGVPKDPNGCRRPESFPEERDALRINCPARVRYTVNAGDFAISTGNSAVTSLQRYLRYIAKCLYSDAVFRSI